MARTIVVKFGGNAMVDEALATAFAEDIVALHDRGDRVVVTHGGGPQISAALEARGIESEFRGGLRFTSTDAALIVRDVLAEIGADLASRINGVGGVARHFSGLHGLFAAERRGTIVDGAHVDLGEVGEVTEVDAKPLLGALAEGVIPVVSASAVDAAGAVLNVNADSAAASVAVAVAADELVVLTDVAGLYRAWPDPDSLVTELNAEELRDLSPVLESGMIPKTAACLAALDGGVARARIIDGRLPHPLTRDGADSSGTTITPGSRTTHTSTPRHNSTTDRRTHA